MATARNVPVSEILRNKSQFEEDEPKKKSREDWRKAKELEEARKVLWIRMKCTKCKYTILSYLTRVSSNSGYTIQDHNSL